MIKDLNITAFDVGDYISDGVCLLDKNGVIMDFNKSFAEIMGVKSINLIGTAIDSIGEQPNFGETSEESEEVTLYGKTFKENMDSMISNKKDKLSALIHISKTNKEILLSMNIIKGKGCNEFQVLGVVRDLTEITRLKDKLRKVEKEKSKYLNELNHLRENIAESSNLLGNSLPIKQVKELIKYVSKTDATVLITGETGAGKEVVANEIYYKSKRKDLPHIKVNCAAIPENLIESELFGYEKGAFTGALNKSKMGMFELANTGTIFLDEIGELHINLQTKLLRVLQEKEIMRVGGTKPIKLDVRVIAATNQDLQELVNRKAFREDLYYRLNVIQIKIPPIRERKDDIPILAYNFLEKFNLEYCKDKVFNEISIRALQCYDWPGNVRQLKNTIERLVIVDDDHYITLQKIESIIGKGKIPSFNNYNITLKEAIDRVEKELIENALRIHGSTHKAAKVLGVTQPTVFRKAKALGIKLDLT